MTEKAAITISLPSFIFGTLEAATARQGISCDEACRRIISGLFNLSDADLRTLPEPPRERRYRDLKVEMEWVYLDRLSEATRVSRLTISSIFRRILHALLITHGIRFAKRENEYGFRLELTQMHFEFADEYESTGPSPLLSRQHRDKI